MKRNLKNLLSNKGRVLRRFGIPENRLAINRRRCLANLL